LFDNGYGIRLCKCGKYYRLAEAIDMGLLASPQTQEIEVDEHGNEIFNIPAFLLRGADETFVDTVKNDAKSFVQKLRSLFGKKREEQQKLTKKIVVQQPLPADRVQHIPNAVRVNDSEMIEIIKDKDLYSNDMVLAARERYRMHLNDKYREPFKDYCKDRSRPIPDYEVSDEHLANTTEILSSYLNSEKIDWMDVGDLYRELGEFAKALECFEKAKNSEHNGNPPIFNGRLK